MKLFYLILLLLPFRLSAQCMGDTLDVNYTFIDSTKLGTSLDCYASACGPCLTNVVIYNPYLDGCISIFAQYGWASAVIRDSCNKVLFDTCVYVPPTGIPADLCYSYPSPTTLTLCRDTISWFQIRYYQNTNPPAWPLLTTIVNLDTLCQSPVYITQPIKVDSILIGSYDLQGRPWKSGPRIDLYQSGTTFYTRKWWDVYKK
jgi:hypothetical protein